MLGWLMDLAGVLASFDEQLRRRARAGSGGWVEVEAQLVRVVEPGGWSGVVWSDLDPLGAGAGAGAGADAAIAEQVAHFRALGEPWEWKWYSYDRPPDLPQRLVAAGLVADPMETVLVAQIADLDLTPRPPAGVELVPVVDEAGVLGLVGLHDAVFGGDHRAVGAAVLAGLAAAPRQVQAVLALVDGLPASGGRVEFHAGTDFASLWGGGTLPAHRGRGLFRSLVAHRAALARDRGFRYLQVDASSESKPILQRLGFVELATTRPYRAERLRRGTLLT